MMHKSDIVVWIITCIFLTIIFARHFWQTHNNSCITAHDYYTNLDKNPKCYYNPDIDLTVPEIIRRYGYEVETLEVATEDHYILKAYRILSKKSDGFTPPQPVYLQHGLFQNSKAFLMQGNKSLPFMLADAGYDVWLGNLRGTLYSRHTYLSKLDNKFWDYSLDEYAYSDVLSLIDLVYEQTQRKIIYIGYSVGATIAYAYSARFPNVAQAKMQLLVALGPTVHPKELKSASRHILSNWNYILPVVKFWSKGSVDVKKFGYFDWSSVCFPFPFQMRLCEVATQLTHDFSLDKIDPEFWPLILVNSFDVVSIKVVTHLSQILASGEFRSFRSSDEENQSKYSNIGVDLSNARIPTYILRAENDAISTKKNVEFLHSNLPVEATKHAVYVIKDGNFTHGDLLWHKDVNTHVNVPIIKFIDEFLVNVRDQE
uniref:Lipase n=2 Tax=Photinus pyralis TaxID=7054 RepID=A0A1Y1M1N7_PHOPY